MSSDSIYTDQSHLVSVSTQSSPVKHISVLETSDLYTSKLPSSSPSIVLVLIFHFWDSGNDDDLSLSIMAMDNLLTRTTPALNDIDKKGTPQLIVSSENC